jgi:hypothetical protein
VTQYVSIVASVIFLSHPACKEVYTGNKSCIILFLRSALSQDVFNMVAFLYRLITFPVY